MDPTFAQAHVNLGFRLTTFDESVAAYSTRAHTAVLHILQRRRCGVSSTVHCDRYKAAIALSPTLVEVSAATALTVIVALELSFVCFVPHVLARMFSAAIDFHSCGRAHRSKGQRLLLAGACCMLYGVCCMLRVVCCMLHAVCCVFPVACCVLRA